MQSRIRKLQRSLPLFAVLGLVIAIGALINWSTPPRAHAQTQVSANDVLPIVQRCFQCHGPSLKMSKLDLSSREGMLKGGEKGPALVPGDSDASPLYRRVAGLEQPRMPMAPVPALNAAEVALLKSWIDQGAKWDTVTVSSNAPATAAPPVQTPYGVYNERQITDADRQWWAFQKPVRRDPPAVNDARWSSNPIDGFVRAMMNEKGLEPAPQADRPTLIRRAYLDLLGLLPPAEEVARFVKDPAPDAYEKLVDRLLASPQYGERWGRFWLDVVRYADSSGFEYDLNIDNAWRYRDYVIKAFNEDKPYNRFVVEQIAGDELDQPDFDSLTATTYYRIGPRVRFREKNYPSYRYDYMDDMIRTTYQGFMGLSVNCARCHDHKFDPITRMDYYRSVADFWSSRATLNSAKHRYEILGVTSPEEDYTDVDNEIYTNQVARQSLEAAVEAAQVLGAAPDPKWREIADALYLPSAGDGGAFFDFDPTTPHDKSTSWMATSVPMLSIPALDFATGADTLRGLFRHSTTAIGPVRGRANQMVLLMLAIQAANVGESGYFSDLIGGSGRDNDPFLKPPFNVRSETPQNDSTYLLASSGGFVQALVYGLTGLRIEEAGLVQKFPPTLPNSLSYLRLANLEFRGKALDVVISRLPSGRVVRRVIFKKVGH